MLSLHLFTTGNITRFYDKRQVPLVYDIIKLNPFYNNKQHIVH